MIEKTSQDFPRHEASLALPLDAVCTEDPGVYYKWYTRFHEESGWTIQGKLLEDIDTWVQEFSAKHPVHGVVEGDFDTKVRATSEAALEHFLQNHPPQNRDPAGS